MDKKKTCGSFVISVFFLFDVIIVLFKDQYFHDCVVFFNMLFYVYGIVMYNFYLFTPFQTSIGKKKNLRKRSIVPPQL